MSILAVFLLAVGIGDLCRRPSWPPWIPLLAAPATVVAAGGLAGLGSRADLALLVLAGLLAAAWIMLVARSRRYGRGHGWSLLVLLGGVVLTTLLAGAASRASGWLADWLRWSGWPALQHLPPARFLLLLGLFAVQLSTGNEFVRLVLAAIGAIRPQGEPQAADQLRGGRLLGPMERIFVLGLSLAGHVTAAGLVITAKGLIRFPELSARRADLTTRGAETTKIKGIGIDRVTEYFLLGSFLSWLLAMAGVGIAALS